MFEMGAKFEDEDYSVKKKKPKEKLSYEIKTASQHRLHFAKERRRGKIVTIVKPFYLEKTVMQDRLKTLKKKLGCGGTIKDNSLEFQGEIKERLKIELINLGFGIK